MKNLLLFTTCLISFPAFADIIPPSLNWDAGLDTNGNNAWESSVNPGTTAQFNFSGAQSTSTVTSPHYPLISEAYSMPGAVGTMNTFSTVASGSGNALNFFDATFELVFRPVDIDNNYYLFETGGNGSGLAFAIFESNLVFRAQEAPNAAQMAEVSLALSPADLNRFHQVVGVIDLDAAAGANSLSLYVNGSLVGSTSATGVLSNFAGGDGSGLGRLGGGSLAGIDNGVVASTFTNFNGDIAALRYYENQLFTIDDVNQNRLALIPEPSSAVLLMVGAACLMLLRRRS